MKHIVYISPNAREYHSATMQDLALAASNNPRETLESLRNRSEEEVLIFESPEQLARAFNNDGTISDEGFLLIIDDHVSERDAILDLIKEDCIAVGVQSHKDNRTCFEIVLLPPADTDYDEAKEAVDALCPELPVYMVASNRDGDWFEEKVRRVTCFADGQPEFQLESGYWLDATEPFIENLMSLEYILKKLCPSDVKEFHEKYA